MSKLTTGQIGQLIEIDRAGDGIGEHVQELIICLTSGGVAGKLTNPREVMAKCLWDRGFGRDPQVNAENFKVYLSQIPQIPAELVKNDAELQLLSLADPRPGLLRSCKLLGIRHEELHYSEDSSVPFDENFPLPTTPFWFRHDDGRKNNKRRPDHCRNEFVGDVIAGSAIDGIFAYAHNPDIINDEYIIDLPRTVLRDCRVLCADLRVWEGQEELCLHRNSDEAGRNAGSLRVRRK